MSGKPEAFTAYSLAELRLLEFPEHTWLVEDLIPAGSLTLLVGRPKAGKSLLALDMLASVALGETFAGRATVRSRAIYGSAEDSLRLVRERLNARLGPDDQAGLLVMPFDGSIDQWLRIDLVESFTALARTVGARRPGLLVLDPLREIHNQPENDADAMAAVLRPLRHLAHESNCAIVVVHHRNKYSSDPATAARGSSAIVGSVDQTITLDVADAAADDATLPVSVFIEGRYGPRQRLTIRMDGGFRWAPAEPTPIKADTATRMLAVLGAQPGWLSAADLAQATNLAEKTILNHLSRLHAQGDVERSGEGQRASPYRYRLRARCAGEQGDGEAAFQPRLEESIRTCRECGGNLWREVASDVWRCAQCEG